MRKCLGLLLVLLSGSIYSQEYTSQLMKEIDLKELTYEGLGLLRNEILARRGYVFSNEKYNEYFLYKEWYKPLSSNNEVRLTSNDETNITIIKELEQKEYVIRERVFQDLTTLKHMLLSSNEEGIKRFFAAKKDIDGDTKKYLKEILIHCKIEDIYFNETKGVYSVEINNGKIGLRYSIEIGKRNVLFRRDSLRNDNVLGKIDQRNYNHIIEPEWNLIWSFKVIDTGLTFESFFGAG